MARAIRTCKRCGGKFAEYRVYRGPNGDQRTREWAEAAANTPGLCNDCRIAMGHQAACEAASDDQLDEAERKRRYEKEIASLELPALTGTTERQIQQAEHIRRRFFENAGNLRLAKLLLLAPQIYEESSHDKKDAMLLATSKAGWGNDYVGAFAYANAGLNRSDYSEMMGERFWGKPQEYIQIIKAMLSETDAKAIIALSLK